MASQPTSLFPIGQVLEISFATFSSTRRIGLVGRLLLQLQGLSR